MPYIISGLVVCYAVVGKFKIISDFTTVGDAFGEIAGRHRPSEDPIVLASACF